MSTICEPVNELREIMSDEESKRLLERIIDNQESAEKAQDARLSTIHDSVNDLSRELKEHITDDEKAYKEVSGKLNELQLDVQTRFAKLEGMKMIAVPVIFGLGTLAMWALKALFGE